MSPRIIAIVISSLGLFGCGAGAGAVGSASVREPEVGSSSDGSTTNTAHTAPAATKPAAAPADKKEQGKQGQDIDWLSRMTPQ